MEGKTRTGMDSFSPENHEEDEVDLRKYLQIFMRHKWTILIFGALSGVIALGVLLSMPTKYEASAVISIDTGRANVVAIDDVYEGGNKTWEYLQTQVELIQSRQIVGKVIDSLELQNRTEFNPDPKDDTASSDTDRRADESLGARPIVGASNIRDDIPAPYQNGSSAGPAIGSIENDLFNNTASITFTDDLSSYEERLRLSTIEENQKGPVDGDKNEPRGAELDNAQSQAEYEDHDIIVSFQKRLKVENLPNTQLIKIEFVSESAELSAEVANAVANTYIDSLKNTEGEMRDRANTWLTAKIDGLRTTLEQSEKELFDFRYAENLVDLEGVRGIASKELNDATAHLMETRRELQKVANTRSQLQSKALNTDDLISLPVTQSSTVIQGIKKIEAEAQLNVSELALRYGPKHPKMISAISELQAIKAQLNSEIGQLVAGVEGEYQVALANEAAALRDFERAKSEYQRLTGKEARHAELQRQVKIDRDLYNTFLTRLREMNQAGGFDSDSARVADPAVTPRHPIDKKINLIVALAIVLGLGLGAMAAMLHELVYDGVKSSEDVDGVLRQNLFGVIPLVKKVADADDDLRTYFDAKQYQFSEAVRTLRTSLVLYHLESSGRVISVTSSVPEEGKTTVSINLAFSLAQIESVLLIDCDLRRPSIAREFGIPKNHPGITELIAENNSLDECIFHDKESGLDIMPAGTLPPDAQKVIGSVSFANHIKVLASLYDRIIIDTSPVRAVSDALLVGKHVDSRLYVVKANATSKRLIRRGLDRFAKSGLVIDGIVVNQIDADGAEDGYDYYRDQYGYGNPSAIAGTDLEGDESEENKVMDEASPASGSPGDSDGQAAMPSKHKLDTV